MRIIGGLKRGMRLQAPTGTTTRPTMDRARETLLNILLNNADFRPCVMGAIVADVFAGSGAVGLEMLSRGASHCVFYENAPTALHSLHTNIKQFGAHMCSIRNNALKPHPEQQAFGCVFFDAPYTDKTLSQRAIDTFIQSGLIATNTLIIVQLDSTQSPPVIDGFSIQKDRKIGGGSVYFYRT